MAYPLTAPSATTLPMTVEELAATAQSAYGTAPPPSPLESFMELAAKMPLYIPQIGATTAGDLIPAARLALKVGGEITKVAVKSLIVDPALELYNAGAFLSELALLGGEATISTARGLFAMGTALGQVDQESIMRIQAGLPPKGGYVPAKDALLNQLAKDLTFEDLPSEERMLRARRGLALVGGAIATAGMSTLVQLGGRAAISRPVGGAIYAVGQKILGKSEPIIKAVSNGILEGVAFGSTFGTLTPLDPEGFSRSESILYNTFGAAGLMGIFRGFGAARYYSGERPTNETSAVVLSAAKDLTKQIQTETLLQQRNLRPVPTPGVTPEELVAQEAAGIHTYGLNRTSFIGRLGQAVEDFIQVRFPDVRRVEMSTWFSANKAAQAKVPAMYLAETYSRATLNGLTEIEAKTLGNSIFLSRMRAVEQRITQDLTRAQAAGDSKRVEKLTLEVARVQGWGELALPEQVIFNNSPAIKRALKVLDETVSPAITEIRFRNGLRTYQETDLPFLPLVRATPEEIAAGVAVRTRTPNIPGGRVVGGPITAQTTTGARQATGQGDAYITDIRTILARTFVDDVNKDLHNELLANVITAPWATRLRMVGKTANGAPIYERAPSEIVVNGVKWPVKIVDLRGNRRVLDERFGLSSIKNIPETVTPQAGTRIAGTLEPGGLRLPPGGATPAPQLPRGLPTEVEGPMLKGFLGETPIRGLLGPGKAVGEALPRELTIPLEALEEVEGQIVEPILGRYAVPKPIADMLNETFLTKREDFIKLKELEPIFRAMDFSVGLLLMSPVEVTAHTNRIVSILSENAQIGGAFDQIVALMVPYIGPKFAGFNSIYRVFDTPEGAQMLNTLAQIPGALPSRFLQHEYQNGPGALLGRFSSKAAQAAESGRRFLFDLPEFEPGWKGFDTRARVVASITLRRGINTKLGREPTTNEYLAHLRQFGLYTNEIQSNLVAGLRANRLTPFGGLQAGAVPGELRRLFGGLNLPKETIDELSTKAWAAWKAEVLWRGVIGTTTFLTLANYAASGKWPWENEKGSTLDLDTGQRTQDGRAIYIPFTLLQPTISRAMTITAARAVLEQLGETGGFVTEATKKLAQTPLTYLIGGSPGVQAALTFGLGKAPYLTGAGELMSVSAPQPTDALLMKERATDAFFSSNPTLEAFFSRHQREIKGPGLRIVDAITPGLKVGRQPDQAITAGLRSEFARDYEVVQDRVSRALELPRGTVRAYLREEAKRWPQEKQRRMFILMIQEFQGRRRGLQISKARVQRQQ